MDATELNQLMARLGEGDRSAFPAVFRELWPRVRAFCASLVPGADAEDAAQQAMEKILTRAAQYDPQRPALAWALAIAAWESRTVARWRQRRREIDVDVLSTASEQSQTEGTAEEAFIVHELQRAAVLALGQLSESDRAELARAYWEESNAGAPAARKRRQRAIERLRGTFRRLYGTD